VSDERPRVARDLQPEGGALPKRTRKTPLVLLVLLVLVVLLSPFWLRRLDYFRVRRVEVVGARYVPPKSLLDQLALDSTATIWENLGPLEARLRHHPQVREVKISRRLPGTLVLRIVENLPVALISTADGMRPVDRDARLLPIEPSRTPVDLPIIARKDSTVLHMLDGVRLSNPALFARVSEVQWDDRGGLRVFLSGMTVRAAADCTWERFAEIIPVEQDLARRGRRAAELDLRYRDQIVARIE
jgi:cell division protein FtsQ